MTSRLPRYEAKYVHRYYAVARPMGVGPSAFRYQGHGTTPANILIPLEKQSIAL